jgi:hypothetical protein
MWSHRYTPVDGAVIRTRRLQCMRGIFLQITDSMTRALELLKHLRAQVEAMTNDMFGCRVNGEEIYSQQNACAPRRRCAIPGIRSAGVQL